MKINSPLDENTATTRKKIRKDIRKIRNSLSIEQQKDAEEKLNINFIQHVNLPKEARIGIYLENDGELRTNLLIQSLWSKGVKLYLPVIHPFSGVTLLFQKYEKNSPMRQNRYAILEPELNCSQICPLAQLDYLLLPLVAFDDAGNRLGMGGGYYDRTLARYYRENWQQPKLIGLAHDCQKVPALPTEAWDVPLPTIITPQKCYQW
ncbi:5-formyltetrahydrofolate cyclo-ligase [Pseudoalteromonas rubra]|uniref:5-formyltetrahydrofolate cyclo-ligase n=1 Tax=Pseudoalteromonas rubra TaxID=43658 RepID=A0A5S3WPQ0_9GAMM|nr:5-formyltetrahydrofolate cyclo-ligase [Pseudoalteromonas rubra]TMP29589.1 5-formyltetrahydrofolate cyclo-ligase [Pseudoalteromonas rubra]TMP35182.1 5-formyltetrahydrofolate cyclo-ligase [Pseudoalteromonas rubra]